MAPGERADKFASFRVNLAESKSIFLRAVRRTREDRNLLGAAGTFLLLTGAGYAAGAYAVLRYANDQPREIQNILLNVLVMPWLAYFTGGLLQFFREKTNGGSPPWSVLLRGHWHYFRILLYCIAYYTAYRLLVRTVTDMSDYPLEFQLRLAFGLPLFIWVCTRVCFAFAFVTEQNLGPRLGIKSSFILTGGRFWRTLIILFPLPALVSVSGLTIGLIPHSVVVLSVFFVFAVVLVPSVSVIMLTYFWMFDRYRQEPTVVEIAAIR